VRLLFLNHNYRYGGTYYRAMPLAEQLAQRDHVVTLLTVSREHRWRPTWSVTNGVRLGEMPNWGQDNSGEGYGPLDNSLRLLHALRHRYDIIHMLDHKPNATLAGFLTGRLRGARLVADWVDWWGGAGGINDVLTRRFPVVGTFEAWWEEKSKLWADGVTAISTVLQQRAIRLGYPAEWTLYLPTGAATQRIKPLPTAEARRTLNVPIDRKIIGFIGMGQGDLETVMQALQHLEHVWLMVIGGKTPRVFELAQSFSVADRLWQTGFVPDEQVGVYLACADVMCLPLSDRAANRGRLPNKLLDYMCAGRPTVAHPVGDVKTIMETYSVGLLANEGPLAPALERLLTDDQLRRTLGQNARHIAETVFGWPHLIDQLENFYVRVLKRAR
jgi:glycosyltransferase involved in cell wall biosynthesis